MNKFQIPMKKKVREEDICIQKKKHNQLSIY